MRSIGDENVLGSEIATPYPPQNSRRFRDLRPLFDPRSVAVIGASDDPAKWGNSAGLSLLESRNRRSVYVVSRKPKVLGCKAYPSFSDLPEPPEFVEVIVPAPFFEQTIYDALDAGARALVGITAGLGETGEEGRALERRVAARVRAAGAVLLGPNCFGVIDNTTELQAMPLVRLQPGTVAFIAQSGNVAYDVRTRLQEFGLGISRFVSIGNQADLQVADVVVSCVEHEQTQIIAVYCEDFHGGRAFVEAALAARAVGKHVVLLSPGCTEAATRAAWFHTGSRTSPAEVVDAVCRAAGIYRVYSTRELCDFVFALHAGLRPPGRRVGLITTGGGNAVIASDVLGRAGLDVCRFSPQLTERIAALLPETPNPGNPVDQVERSSRTPA